MTMLPYASIVLAALAAASPAPSATALPTVSPAMLDMPMPSFTQQQEHFSVKSGEPFQIRLNVTSGTGYSWQPAGPMPPGIALVGVSTQTRGKIPGGPGEEVLVFRAQTPGTARLTVQYVRPWERSVKPAKLQTFTVTVHK